MIFSFNVDRVFSEIEIYQLTGFVLEVSLPVYMYTHIYIIAEYIAGM